MAIIYITFIQEFIKVLVTSAGWAAALAWNSAFQSLFKQYPKFQKKGPWAYAIIVTFLTLFIISFSNYFKSLYGDHHYHPNKNHST